ncbi:MAG: AIR synthase-related protein, partial [Endomicrobiia bacterium]
AVVEKMFLDVLLKSRDLGLYTAITDCGAGGLSSACGELTKDCGCEIFLDNVPLKYEGLKPWEIWISESQERMVVILDSDKKEQFIKLCSSENVEATVIGKVTNTKKLELYFKKIKVCDIDMDFLHNGNPKLEFNIENNISEVKIKNDVKISYPIKDLVRKVLSHSNICSKEWVIRQYDYEVQGNTVLKPLVGNIESCIERVSPQDAAIIQPLSDSVKCVAISCGINPLYGKYDVVSMTESVIDEAIRNIICVGGKLDKIFLLDNFCWGDVKDEEQLASLFLSCETAKKVAEYFATPFISGKDSLNNYFLLENKKINIPPTLLISAIGIIDDVYKTISSEFKDFNNEIYLIGKTNNELCGSILYEVLQKKSGLPPFLDYNIAKKIYQTFEKLKPYILSAHDCSDGGVITSIIEMTFGRNIGVELNLSKVNNLLEFLFSESNSRIVIEILPNNKKLVENVLLSEKIPFTYLGKTVFKPTVSIKYKNEIVLNEKINWFYEIWSKSLVF